MFFVSFTDMEKYTCSLRKHCSYLFELIINMYLKYVLKIHDSFDFSHIIKVNKVMFLCFKMCFVFKKCNQTT